ncbi:MAG: NAD(P)H-hydrate dehydratase [Pseudomonadota bacterium]
MKLSDYHHLLKPRSKQSHKGDFGHVLIVGGGIGFSGAPRLAAMAAARVGAGLITIATHPNHSALMTMTRPELMSHPVETDQQLQALINKATVIAVGPGLGVSDWARLLLATVLRQSKPMIIDADGLNLIARQPARHYDHAILTPHPGEAARLLDCTTERIQADRQQAIQQLWQRYQAVTVLKGANTLVIDEQERVNTCEDGNPGMASGGMGDLLTGVIAGLVAQGLSLGDAANCGVCLHARAGDLAAAEKGQRGLLATDLLAYIQKLVNP